MTYSCTRCQHEFSYEPVMHTICGSPAHAFYFCSGKCRRQWLEARNPPAPEAVEMLAPPPPPAMADAAEMLWIVLANVSGGDWSKQTPEWQGAAGRGRETYFAAQFPSYPAPPTAVGADCGKGESVSIVAPSVPIAEDLAALDRTCWWDARRKAWTNLRGSWSAVYWMPIPEPPTSPVLPSQGAPTP